MKEKVTLMVENKIHILNKSIEFDFKNFFVSISEGVLAFSTMNKPDLIKSVISLINSLKFKDKPETLVYTLIINSFQEALLEIINENLNKFHSEFTTIEKFNEYKEFQELLNEIDTIVSNDCLVIDTNFFNDPTKISIFNSLTKLVIKWLTLFGLSHNDAKIASNKLTPYFIFSINDNWRKNSDEYQIILKEIITPFSTITKIELEWKSYHAYLKKLVEEPVFDEYFGIKDIFIPTPGFIEKKNELNEIILIERHIINVFDFLDNWLTQTKNEEDCIKVISGGPGSGKSTLAKLFATHISEEANFKTLYIPLQHLNIKNDLTLSLGDYLSESNFFQHNPLEEIHQHTSKLLIIFDGLDELSKQGKHAYELSREFIIEIQRKISTINQKELKLFVLLTGRELSVQYQSTLFRRPEQVINLLPYFCNNNEEYIDKEGVLSKDLRNDWWVNYGKLKGLNYTIFPNELRNPSLDEITAQPLLNYLVALTFERKIIKFSENTNLNEIYGDLIKAVYDRQYERKQHKVITELSISEDNFFRILEEISISAWHSGDIRTTTISEINKHIAHNSLDTLFNEFQLGVHAGISRLLTAFYFRQKGVDNDQNKTFEFTHKSFGEYLASRRIINYILLLNRKIKAYDINPDEGLTRKEALKKIIETLGVMPIDDYLFTFLHNEIKLSKRIEIEELQRNLITLIEYILSNGMPVELLSPRPNFNTELCYYRNTVLCLFILLKISSDYTNIKSNINWSTDSILAELFAIMTSLKPQITVKKTRRSPNFYDETGSLFNICFTNMVIVNCRLVASNLTFSDFSNSILHNVVLAGSDVFGSNFINTEFIDVNFFRTNLQRCRFENTNIVDSNYFSINHVLELQSFENIRGLDDEFITNALLARQKFEKDKNLN